MIGRIILGVLLLVFTAVLLTPVQVRAVYEKGGLTVRVRYSLKKKIEEKVSFAVQLQEMLDQRDGDSIAKITILKDLMDSKFTLLDKLCGLINESSDNAKRGLTERLSSLISELSISGDKISELEKQVDLIHDNLMTDFRNDLPDLKDADYCLFLFSVLNLSSVAITLLLKESKVNAIYDRRRRLKDKLKRLDDDKKERYLSFL